MFKVSSYITMHDPPPAAAPAQKGPEADETPRPPSDGAAVSNDGKEACPQTGSGGPQATPLAEADKTASAQAKRARRLELQRDARDLLDDLGRGLTVAEICERRSWSRDAYFRRMRIAEKMTSREYDPAHTMAVFLKDAARYRLAQRSAGVRLQELESAFKDLAHSAEANPFIVPALTHAYVRLLAFSLDCDDRTFRRAVELGVVPPVSKDKREFTVAEWVEFAHKILGDAATNPLPPYESDPRFSCGPLEPDKP